jgi:hypothetical protein
LLHCATGFAVGTQTPVANDGFPVFRNAIPISQFGFPVISSREFYANPRKSLRNSGYDLDRKVKNYEIYLLIPCS